MSTVAATNTERLLEALASRGTATARELTETLGISQPTVSRLLRAAGDRVVAIGETRRRRYAATRDIRGLGRSWPLYRINAHGRPSLFGQLHALHDGRFHVHAHVDVAWLRGEFADGLFPGLPWFMEDMRPQGFLGRRFAHRLGPGMGLRDELTLWDNNDIISALLLHGSDTPGRFVLGERALEAALTDAPEAVAASDRAQVWAARATAITAGEPAGSSVAGEQPKFTACVRDQDERLHHVIVKFSDRMPFNATSQRWADLLLAEHLAIQVLRQHGIACADTALLDTEDGRRCLESTRFDRIDAHGREGLVTLAALDDAHHGQRDHWALSAQRLLNDGWIDANDAWRMTLCWWFGRLIGNTDMHFGNVGFFLDDALPLRLAPVYDMLPMHFRPTASGTVTRQALTPAPPQPESMATWQQAARMARSFWQQLENHPQLSDDFRPLAQAQAHALATMQQRFG